MTRLRVIWWILRLFPLSPSQLVLENLALRQQLAVLSRQLPRPRLPRRDRLFWVCLAKLWSGWRAALVLVQPQTVVRCHRQGFRLWWRWKSKARRPGLPALARDGRALITRMAVENPTWGVPAFRSNQIPHSGCWRSPPQRW